MRRALLNPLYGAGPNTAVTPLCRRAPVAGDRRLIERLVSNLVENAIRHNEPSGRVRVAVRAAQAILAIANTGPPVPAEEVERLLQPFQRLNADRVARDEGLGLGLSIVAAIITAHGATLSIRPGSTGGLSIEVRFPTVPDRGPAATDRLRHPKVPTLVLSTR